MSLDLEGYEKKLKRFVSPTFSGENNDLGRVCNFLKMHDANLFRSYTTSSFMLGSNIEIFKGSFNLIYSSS